MGDNRIEPAEGAYANPYSRLEAISRLTERLNWLTEHLERQWPVVTGPAVALILGGLSDGLDQAVRGDLAAVQRLLAQPARSEWENSWDGILDPEGVL